MRKCVVYWKCASCGSVQVTKNKSYLEWHSCDCGQVEVAIKKGDVKISDYDHFVLLGFEEEDC